MKIEKKLSAIQNTKEKAEQLLIDLESATGKKLAATTENDVVDGYINVFSDGRVEVYFYDSDEIPNTKHKTTLRKHIPTTAQIQQIKDVIV